MYGTYQQRLQAVADLVTAGYQLADIGTDHAYIPIYLIEQNRFPERSQWILIEGPLAEGGRTYSRK